MASKAPRRDHGWWPYLLPYFVFLLLGEVQARLAPEVVPFFRAGRVALTAALLLYFFRRGRYPELRGYPAQLAPLDGVVGVVGLALWVVPYLAIAALPRPAPGEGFHPEALGEAWQPYVLAARFVGFALVTPVMEELFVRSFLLRWLDVYDTTEDFRKVPIGRYRPRSFWITIVAFTVSHARWEWPVAAAWCALANGWLYRRRHIGSAIVLHAATNAGLFLLALAADGWGHDLWWFL
ncbi:MAG TPA: CAAX prenyl protease-related protein [Myxococcota bacterium]|jgi:CAAX prenyl protease-like protein|nr:CAAX prenyl protease-related protein [Myxococcota bacterium]